jgi:hypothetical protein
MIRVKAFEPDSNLKLVFLAVVVLMIFATVANSLDSSREMVECGEMARIEGFLKYKSTNGVCTVQMGEHYVPIDFAIYFKGELK